MERGQGVVMNISAWSDSRKGTIIGPSIYGHYLVKWDDQYSEEIVYGPDLTPIEEATINRCDYAELVCRELRYQLVKYGNIGDADAIMYHLNRWIGSADKIKYDRPELPKTKQQ